MRRFDRLKQLWRTDLYRYEARTDAKALVHALVTIPGYRYTFVMRACQVLTAGRGRAAHGIAVLVLARYSRKYGISIPFDTEIGEGFYIGHFGGIVVNYRARIGRNCNISHGVTLGQTNRGSRAGAPLIGDGVYIGPGAKVIGAVTIGNNVAIGANCVVTDDIPDNSVVAGTPGRVISDRGAEAYVNYTDY
jgi:serine O-acetyltransferase